MTDTQLLCKIVGPDILRDLQDQLGGRMVYIPASRFPELMVRNDHIITVYSESLNQGSTAMNAYKRAAEETGISVRQVQRVVAAS